MNILFVRISMQLILKTLLRFHLERMKSSFRLLLIGIGMNLFCFVSSLSAKAVPDDVTVFAKIDTTQIRIGEQIKLNLTASAPPGAKFKFPLIPDTMNGLEFVNRSGIDTLKSENGKNIIYSQLSLIHISEPTRPY